MKYTEEEKKAIELLDKLIINANTENADMNDCFFGEHVDAIEVLKNLVEKQQKEIEELKYKYKKYGKVLFTEDAIKENYVSKNEIREKIKTFKNLPNLGIFQSKEPIIRVLMELLGDE